MAVLWLCQPVQLITIPNNYNKQGFNGQCPNLDEEACGVNNITYQNECFLGRAGVGKAYDGWCINGQNTASPITFGGGPTQGPIGNPNFNPTSIPVANGGSQLLLHKWWRNPDNGYLTPGESYVGCPCNDSFLPVCGSNGMTYANMCRSECANVKAVKYGECGDYNYVWPGPSSCICGFEIDTSNSVCGVNERTYESKCVASCANVPSIGGGFCKNSCDCAHYFRPVCGRDGATYDNTCKLDCKGVAKLHEGICSKDSVDQCFFCQGDIKRVCGDDGETYDNICYLKCRRANLKSDGACPLKPGEVCNCPEVNLPVCGMDDVTYKNECELNCAGMPKQGNKACYLYKREINSCQNKCKNQKYNPICGGNGRTFNNSCDAGCGGVSVISNGPCGSAKNTTHCVCSDEPFPVCGVDGRDYINKCALECAGLSLAWDGPCNMHVTQSGARYKTMQVSAGGAVVGGTTTGPGTPMPIMNPAPAPILAPIPAPVVQSQLAPSMAEIQNMINLTLTKNIQPIAPTIIVLPSLPQTPTKKQPIQVNLQFVNPNGTKTIVENQQVMQEPLNRSDFYENKSESGDNLKTRIHLKMNHQMSLEKLYTLISIQPESFYEYFNTMISKGAITKQSIMFKGLSVGKLMSYMSSHYGLGNKNDNYGEVTVGNSH